MHPDVFKLALPDDKSSTITLSHLHQHSSINGQQPTIINQQPSTTIEQQLANDTSTTITPPHINEHSSTINEQQPVTINQQPPITNDQQFVSTSDEQDIPILSDRTTSIQQHFSNSTHAQQPTTGTQQQPTSTSSSSQSYKDLLIDLQQSFKNHCDDDAHIITVRRRRLWPDTVQKLPRYLSKGIKPMRFIFANEEAVDSGWPTREYFSLKLTLVGQLESTSKFDHGRKRKW